MADEQERRLAKTAFALLIGAVAGYLFNQATLPLPWMLGPMIANLLAAVWL